MAETMVYLCRGVLEMAEADQQQDVCMSGVW